MIPSVHPLLTGDAAVASIVGDRVYQTEAPEDAVRPYVVFSLPSSTPLNNLSCAPDMDDQRVQVDCWAQSQSKARELGKAVRNALEQVTHVILGPWADRDEATKMYRWSMDAEFWSAR